jgi:ketol-acid reductoisomerase
MTTILHDDDADLSVLDGARVAIVGYGNQGRSWALNLRDSGLDVRVCVRADASREQAVTDGFEASDLAAASDADVICAIVPDDAIPGPEVRLCYTEGIGFITAFGVHRDETGTARARTLAVAKAIGGLKQGSIELTPAQEAILDLAVEQALSPALRHVSQSFVGVMLENGIPLEAILTELVLSGEVERTYRLLREEGYAAQMAHHSPVSQYGQLSRAEQFTHLDVPGRMREIVNGIADGSFADEWDGEKAAGFARFEELKKAAVGPEIIEFEQGLRTQLGQGAIS